jgi:hypothetical protein
MVWSGSGNNSTDMILCVHIMIIFSKLSKLCHKWCKMMVCSSPIIKYFVSSKSVNWFRRYCMFFIEKFFYNISKTIDWIGFWLLGQLHMVILHVACVFHEAALIWCEMAEVLIFAKIFRPLYLKNYKGDNVEFFYGKPLWHEEDLVEIPRTLGNAFSLYNFF